MNELIVRNGDNYILTSEALIEVVNIDLAEKKLKEKKEDIRARILKEMEAKGIKKMDMPELSITYKFASDSEYFNKDKFRNERPDIYDEYIEMRETKPSITVKIKNGNK